MAAYTAIKQDCSVSEGPEETGWWDWSDLVLQWEWTATGLTSW